MAKAASSKTGKSAASGSADTPNAAPSAADTTPPLNGFDTQNRPLRREARSLYWRGWTVTQISAELGLNASTVNSWKRRDGWHNDDPVRIVEDRLEIQLANYLDRPSINEGDMKRIDFLMRQMERAARIRKYNQTGKEGDLNGKIAKRNDGEAVAKRAKKKNQLTHDQIEDLRAAFHDSLYLHQREWWQAGLETIRFILKSRQIGATWYFAREALIRALDTGNTQIFLSASQSQSLIFFEYIKDFVLEVTGVELKGSKPLTINRLDENGDELPPLKFRFLATNFRTAQGYNGDVYIDECFWIGGFKDFDEAASAMASQKQFRLTYFSKPSGVNHLAHAKWCGDEYNDGRPKAEQIKLDVSHKALADGKRGPDDRWRQIVTLDDAIAKGYDLIDRASVEKRYSPEIFRNQYLCAFLDDSKSAFPFDLVGPCRVNSFNLWRDFQPALVNIPGSKPFADKRVVIGVDPNNQGRDDAAIAVLAVPEGAGKPFRLLEKLRFTGEDFAGQNERIKQVYNRYNVVDIAIDISGGMGKAVFELVALWFPMARRIDYSVAVKSHLVQKAQNLMRTKRFEFDRADTDVQAAFMAIRPSITPSGRHVTYKTQRAEGIGHGDIAWAIMHAMSWETLTGEAMTGGGFAIFSTDTEH